jgi:GT2 family glycosyltransferase
MDKPKASVIILAWNGREYLEACLDAVLNQDYARLQVIVVDNGSTDGSPEVVTEGFPEVKLIQNGRNLGFAAGNNIGLRAADGDVLVLLNQDTQVHPGWLEALMLAFEDPDTGIAGCKLLYPDGTIQHAGGYLYGPRGETDHLHRHAQEENLPALTADVEFVTGAALALRRTVMEEVGPLDEGFRPAYYEDIDWCYRVRSCGHRVVYQPQAVVTHYESTSTDALSYERKYAWNQGRGRFVFKHWPLDRLQNEFGPAELAWVAAMDRCEELMAARRAYLNTLLALSGILAFRQSTLDEADAQVSLLTDLRAAAQTTLASMARADDVAAIDQVPASLLSELAENQILREQPFTSQAPVFGRLIVAFRNLWNSVAAKWYVRPLTQQQSQFNAQLVNYLRSVEQRLQGQSRDVAENIGELTAIAEYLVRAEETDSRSESNG